MEAKKGLPKRRYDLTLSFLKKYVDKNEQILDLGVKNPFTEILKNEGFSVINTGGEDLDFSYNFKDKQNIQVVTAFEILEHLVSPFPLLRDLPGEKLIATVPLRLWFKRAFRNPNNPRAQHYHEFEDWQFDWLLEKSGWNIIHREKWTSPAKKIGIRPFLRRITPRYYAVYAERKS